MENFEQSKQLSVEEILKSKANVGMSGDIGPGYTPDYTLYVESLDTSYKVDENDITIINGKEFRVVWDKKEILNAEAKLELVEKI